ncbi:MAG: A/G-specific adenine glycosylase [Cyanobacteria bacterium J06648_11]
MSQYRPPDLPYADMRQRLLHWYAQHGRSLPWRATRDPYAIWVSEIMLQQTQVKTVLPYYQRWLAALPTIADLANAPQGQILKLWEGLGYYRRARYLQRAAQVICDRHDGVFPRDPEDVLALPGIGRTTAGGILSAAFDGAAPILDGNVKRVLARLVALPVPPSRAVSQQWTLSETLLDPARPRDYNQALLDLGATLCRPRQPLCDRCPWQPECIAYRDTRQAELPMKTPAPERPHKNIAVAVVFRGDLRNGGELLVDRRLDTSMLGGLWEFPGGKIEPHETPAQCAVREVKEEIGIDVEFVEPLGTIQHAYTHFSITLQAFMCRYVSGEAQTLQCAEVRWISPDEIPHFPFPVANQKLFPLLDSWLRKDEISQQSPSS